MKNLYFKKTLFFISFLFICLKGYNQESLKYGIELNTYLESVEENQLIPLLVEAKDDNLISIIQKHGGNLRLQVGNLYAIELPASSVDNFAQEEMVKHIEFSMSKGQALSDTMLINTNVDSIFHQSKPLRAKYSGKGVILGVIDSGIELDHPDFQDSLGNTRVLYLWDQRAGYQPSRQAGNYTYGVEWDSADINAGISTHDDNALEFGHGSNVTGAAASNGNARGNFKGVAPEVNIISVATDFYKPNWLQTVAEAVDYIYLKADSLGMPCVINASIGTYVGSHDGKDIAARMIDSLIRQKEGRSFVCAAGNAATIPFHLQHQLQNDTNFTWFESHPFQWGGLGGLYFEVWSDTNDFSQVQFSIGADKRQSGNFQFRGRTAFDSISNRLNILYNDSIINTQGQRIAEVKTYALKSQGRYKLEVAIIQPDSSNYLFRFETKGSGKLDLWSSYSLFRHSDMVKNNLPSISQFPEIKNYKKPDSLQTIVSSFSCLPSVITVGNYTNRATYTDVSNTFRSINVTPGEISVNSSLGPNRENYLKPDISSAGDYMFAAGRLATINDAIQNNPAKVSQDSLHFRNGGTSMAAPTVAGMVALYLEMCPMANFQKIKFDLLTAAKADQFTQNLPNPKWGYGKADGFQFLKQRVFSPTLTAPNQVCEGDTALIFGNNTTYTYYWNDTLTANPFQITQSGSYFALAKNATGCFSPTDTLSITFIPKPPQPTIIQNGLQLSISNAGQYQWFYNNLVLPNETDSILNVSNSGSYYCEYTDSNACSINSDTVTVIITDIEKWKLFGSSLYPNPSNGIVNLKLNPDDNFNLLTIYDLKGREILHQTLVKSQTQQIQLNLSHIEKGIYILKLTAKSMNQQFKLILQ